MLSGDKSLRIIAGQYRGRNLKSPASLEVRPTSDRLRETLFNIISSRVSGSRFLDLCAGSGAVGIEALSRGASHVTFVERSRKICELIKSNLELCRCPKDKTEIVPSDAGAFLRRALARPHEPWKLVFFDPPYTSDYDGALEVFGSNELLEESGLLIVEHLSKKVLKDEVGRIKRARILKQGDSSLSFYQKRQL